MEDHADKWYCWVPLLTDKEPHVLMDHPIPESTEKFKFEGHEGDPKQFYATVDINSTPCTIPITLEEGFIVISFNGIDEKNQKVTADDLFFTLIPSYHIDITHDNDNRLPPVKAKNHKEAVYAYISNILGGSEDFITLSNTTPDVEGLKKVYLNSFGRIEYGKAFLQRYEKYLDSQTIKDCRERLESISIFITAIYGTVRDSIQDNLAHQSQELSKSMEKLARSTETLSIGVLGLAWFSAAVSIASLSMDYNNTLPLWIVAAIAIIPPVVFISLYWIHRRTHPPKQ